MRHKDDAGIKQKTVRFEETTLQFPIGADHLGTGGVQAEVIAATRDAMAQADGEAKRKGAQVNTRILEAQREGLRAKVGRRGEELEFPGFRNTRKVTFADMGKRGKEELEFPGLRNTRKVTFVDVGPKEDKRDVFKELTAHETEGPSVGFQNLILAQSRTEGRYTKPKERKVEIRRARTDVQILEERFQAIERDLHKSLETVRQGLEAIRQRKAFTGHQEDLGQMMVPASRGQEPEEDPEPELVIAEQELQGVGEEMEADASVFSVSEVSSRYTVKNVSSYKERISRRSVLRDRNRARIS
jgi:hypothetical protein